MAKIKKFITSHTKKSRGRGGLDLVYSLTQWLALLMVTRNQMQTKQWPKLLYLFVSFEGQGNFS